MSTQTQRVVAVQNLIAENLAVRVPSPDTDLLLEGILDSVTLVQLIVEMENRFGVKIELSDLEIDDLRTPRSIAGLLDRLAVTSVHDNDFLLTRVMGNA